MRERLPEVSNIDLPLCRSLLASHLGLPKVLQTRDEIDAAVRNLTEALRTSIKESNFPPPRRAFPKRAPWWNRTLYQLRYKLRSAQKNARYDSSIAATEELKQIKSEYQLEIRKSRSAAWKRFCSDEFNDDPYKAVKKATRKQKPHDVCFLRTPGGQALTTESEILATLATSFFPRDSPSDNPVILKTAKKAKDIDEARNLRPINQGPSLHQDELVRAVFSMKKNKSPGKDCITVEHIQHLFPILKNHLHCIIDASLRLSYFPADWKIAQVLILPKAGKTDYTDPSAY